MWRSTAAKILQVVHEHLLVGDGMGAGFEQVELGEGSRFMRIRRLTTTAAPIVLRWSSAAREGSTIVIWVPVSRRKL